MSRDYCYIGIKPCGCAVALVVIELDFPKDTADSVSKMIRNGLTVERVSRDQAVERLSGDCQCAERAKEESV